VLCIIGLFFQAIQSKAEEKSGIDPFNQSVGALYAGPSEATGRWFRSVNDFLNGFSNSSALIDKAHRLASAELAASLYREKVDELNRQIDSLRKLIGLPALGGRKKVAADVIAYSAAEHRMTLNIGSKKGVRPGMPVATGDGLVGICQFVSPTRTQVALITDPNQRIGAMVLRNPPSIGLLRGESAGMVTLELLDFATPMQNGDVVCTSGLSERVPRGIMIGKIVQIEDRPEFGSRRSRVFPFVSMGAVREVVVLE